MDKQRKEQDLDKNEMMVKERATSQSLRNERIEARSFGRKNGEENDNFCHKRTWKAPFQEGYNGVVGKPTTKRVSLIWSYGIHLKL